MAQSDTSEDIAPAPVQADSVVREMDGVKSAAMAGARMKRVLVVSFSQTGQLTGIIRSVTASLQASFCVDFEELQPVEPYPFPWPLGRFLDVMPESVLMQGPALRPLKCATAQPYDLVILAYTVWYLSPAPPIAAFLDSPEAARLLRGRPVMTLVGCRGMWLMAHQQVRRRLVELGARLLDNAVLTDQGGWVSLITTPAWMFTGQRDRFLGIFPPAGIAERDIRDAARLGRAIVQGVGEGRLERGESLWKGFGAVKADGRHLMAERVARRIFLFWARRAQAAGRIGGWLRALTMAGFCFCLVSSVALLLPLLLLFRFLTTPFFRERRQRAVAACEEPSGSERFALEKEVRRGG